MELGGQLVSAGDHVVQRGHAGHSASASERVHNVAYNLTRNTQGDNGGVTLERATCPDPTERLVFVDDTPDDVAWPIRLRDQ